jgi:cupin fold WbuC family metalloprotein
MKIIRTADLASLSRDAAARPRRRLNHNLHPELSDPVQRLLNAVEPGSYVRPHRHGEGVWEIFAVLAGRLKVLTFTEDGTVASTLVLSPGELVELPPRTIHAFAGLEPGTVLFEIKPGPYLVITDKDFATWAPPEGDERAPAVQAWLATAEAGDRYSAP